MNYYEIHHHLLPFRHYRELDLTRWHHHFLSNLTNGVSYLVRSSSLKSNPLYKSGYMISALLPWLIITLFKRNTPILRVTTSTSPCGYVVPSRSSSSKAIFSLLGLSFFPRWSTSSISCWGVMLSISLRWLALILIDTACITSIIPREVALLLLGFLMFVLKYRPFDRPHTPSNAPLWPTISK